MTAPSGPSGALVRMFTERFSATRRGARLARQLALYELHDWGIPGTTRLAADAGLLIAELAANAVLHGRVPGRDFELRLILMDAVLRIEVSDARADRRPAVGPYTEQAESGHGMRIVEALAAGWGVVDRLVGKTVWAELPLADRSAGQGPPAGGFVAGLVRAAAVEGHAEVGGGGRGPAWVDGADAPTR
ncbi:ATP-binding protein [Streptomyces sp. NPDC058674]|uniref:ATP-binding protein n=1 Tax=Streptomyces sp. NPDC058674 TaxID=3346592 RepID=UPI00365C4093